MAKVGTITADGTVNILGAKSAAAGRGNFTTVYVWGTWGGGTVTVNVSPNKTDLFPVTDGALTADGFVNIDAKTDGIHLVTTGSTGASLNYQVV